MILKSMLMVFNINEINSIFNKLGLPIGNEKFQILLQTAEEISIVYFLVVIFTILYFVNMIYSHILRK